MGVGNDRPTVEVDPDEMRALLAGDKKTCRMDAEQFRALLSEERQTTAVAPVETHRLRSVIFVIVGILAIAVVVAIAFVAMRY